MSTKILLADDHGIMREGLRILLEKQPDFSVVATAEDGREAISLVREHNPDVVIMDISMPNLNGVDTTKLIKKDFPEIQVVALSMHSNQQFVSNMLKAGASGYLLKSSVFSDLVRAIRSVMSGNTYLSPELTEDVVKGYLNQLEVARDSTLTVLSGRERLQV